jgi:hypothetical protein
MHILPEKCSTGKLSHWEIFIEQPVLQRNKLQARKWLIFTLRIENL